MLSNSVRSRSTIDPLIIVWALAKLCRGCKENKESPQIYDLKARLREVREFRLGFAATGKSTTTSLSSSEVDIICFKDVMSLADEIRRHRHRKAEYAHSLEEEISKVKNLHAITNTETQSVASENASITQYLVSQGLLSADDPMVASALQDRRHSTISLSMAPTEFSIDETIMESSSEDTRSQSGGAEGPWSSAKDKSYLLLAESEFPDSHTDDESKERIKQCRDLLLKDVEPFREDEFDEEQTWNSLANLVLDER